MGLFAGSVAAHAQPADPAGALAGEGVLAGGGQNEGAATAAVFEPTPAADTAATTERPRDTGPAYVPLLAAAYIVAPVATVWIGHETGSYLTAIPALTLPPLVHVGHRNAWRGGVALVMQPVATYTGGMIGIAATRGRCRTSYDEWCGLEEAALAAAFGYVAWAITDVAFVTDLKLRERRRRIREQQRQRSTPTLGASVEATPLGGLTVGLGGRF